MTFSNDKMMSSTALSDKSSVNAVAFTACSSTVLFVLRFRLINLPIGRSSIISSSSLICSNVNLTCDERAVDGLIALMGLVCVKLVV